MKLLLDITCVRSNNVGTPSQIFAMVICRANMPWLFAVRIRRSYLPWLFIVGVCRSYLPWVHFAYVSKPFLYMSKSFFFVNKPFLNGSKHFLYVSKTFFIYENFSIISVSFCYCCGSYGGHRICESKKRNEVL